MSFKDYGNSTPPLSLDKALRAFKADLARPRPLRPQVILVRNVQEAALIADMIDRARACREDIQRIHRQYREGTEES